MKKLILLKATLLLTLYLNAQSAEDSVKMTINQFFEGMKSADTSLIRGALTEGVIFQTLARKKEGGLTVRSESVDDFIKFISTTTKGDADERITFDMIKIDGVLASAWTPYKFYMKGQFSHCGANSFQLVRLNGSWKIQYIIDTRRRDCNQ